jgi:hypothetical protein
MRGVRESDLRLCLPASPDGPGTLREVADLLDRLQATYVATSTAIILLNDDQILQLLTAKGFDIGTTIRLGRRDNTYYEGIRLWDSIQLVRNNPGFNLDFLGSQLMVILSWIGDKLSENGYFDKSPELEFVRHVRNGIAHGNRFNFLHGEPRRPARFRDSEITPALEGTPVLFEFLSTGDVFDLLDYIKEHLRALP